MGQEIDLLSNYPKSLRDINERSATKTDENRLIARRFDKEFFDGDRSNGYGGFVYNPRFWSPVIPTFQKYWGLTHQSSVLDVGCAKGFMLYDISRSIPGIKVAGVDISEYAIENALTEIKPYIQVANAISLPYESSSFDVVISINTIHNLEEEECAIALQEIERVAKKGSFITVDAYRNIGERERMYAWNLTAKTIMSTEEWIKFFARVGYTGDYYWFIP